MYVKNSNYLKVYVIEKGTPVHTERFVSCMENALLYIRQCMKELPHGEAEVYEYTCSHEYVKQAAFVAW